MRRPPSREDMSSFGMMLEPAGVPWVSWRLLRHGLVILQTYSYTPIIRKMFASGLAVVIHQCACLRAVWHVLLHGLRA